MQSRLIPLLLALGLMTPVSTTAQEAPFAVAPGLFDATRPGDLGLKPAPGTETFTIHAPSAGSDLFHNGVVLVAFNGRLHAQWQVSQRDEDTLDTWIAHSHSDDGGRTWTPPAILSPPATVPGQMRSNGGWWTDGQRLVAFTNVWPTGFQSGDGGYAEYRISEDGENWSPPRRVMGQDGKPVEGIIEQDPHALPGGRIITAFHQRPGMIVAPFYTDDPLAVSGWVRGRFENLPHEGRVSRELEPSLFLHGACATMVFRDQAESFRTLASESCDGGESWSQPTLTDMPDARAKQSAGNLPDGTAFLATAVSHDKARIPLALTLSTDGKLFTRAFLLRGTADLQPLRFAGRYKRPGFHYPKSLVWNGHLYVAYTTNKEDVQVTRVPVAALR
ncbi:sialidase family protein [Niveispirillum sp. KHB5.9]|uniref:sialidase family protein n=1 Tax=Niveispirillum sp. KHB5.9 TaxID=3400269 RepID=UPI003A87CBFA